MDIKHIFAGMTLIYMLVHHREIKENLAAQTAARHASPAKPSPQTPQETEYKELSTTLTYSPMLKASLTP